ncbi:MAG: tyrosine-type recombinase/integrase, partial [Hoeflea sp.]
MPRLNKSYVDSIAPGAREEMHFDDALPGFGLRVYPTGRKLYFVQYRARGRTRRVKVGVHGAVTADEARKLARQRLGEVAKGENPAETIAHERRLPTVANIADRFLTDHVAVRCKPSTAKQYELLIEGVIKPKLGPRKIGDITRTDIAELHHEMRERPYHANRTLSVLSKLFNLSEVWGLRPDGSNPCRHVQRYPERKRERFLSQAEIGRLGTALDEAERDGIELPAAINAIRLLLLTGCRLQEILTLKWDYIQPPYLCLPDSKTGARKIPIDRTVSDVLAGIVPVPGNPYVIAGTKEGQPIGDLHGPWRRIRTYAKLGDVRIHDLRHTYASNALAAGVPIEMVGKLLGHTQIQTTMRYAHLA